MSSEDRLPEWVRRNEASRRADEAADREKTVDERLAETAALSRAVTALADSVANDGA